MRRRDDLPFAMAEYQSRLENVRTEMDRRGLDLFMCFTPESMYYLTGYNTIGYYTYQCLLIPLKGEPATITRHLETDNVRYQTWVERMADYRDEDDPVAVTRSLIHELGLATATIGIEMNAWWLTVDSFLQLQQALPQARFKDTTGLVEQFRILKSPAEIAFARQAAVGAVAGVKAAVEATREGVLDNEIAAAGERGRILASRDYCAAPVFTPTGPKSGQAHNNWEGRRLEKGDVVFYEIGASVRRYHAGLMRSAVIGEPSDLVKRASDASIAGLQAALKVMGPGVAAGEADAACRDLITEAGLGPYFHHRLGYHIGIGYPPTWTERGTFSLNKGVKDVLKPGMIFHVIPMLLIPDVGGIGNSATVLITENGNEPLTKDIALELFVR